jgi:hypothetical protein
VCRAPAALLSNEHNRDLETVLTALFVLVPLVIVNMFSIYWYHQVYQYLYDVWRGVGEGEGEGAGEAL